MKKNKNLKRIIDCSLYVILFILLLFLDIKNFITYTFLFISIILLIAYIYKYYKDKKLQKRVKKDV